MKRNLPPLNALRAFEASARLNSVQRAAHELNVTPTAVSQHSTGRAMRSICITCTPGFAVQWLVPRLQQFQDLHPDIDVRIDASTRLLDLRLEDVDLAVRHGNGRYPGLV